MFSKSIKILFIVLAITGASLLSQEVVEKIVARTASFPVTLLEVRWAKTTRLIPENLSLRAAAEKIALARIVYRRYGRVLPQKMGESYKKQLKEAIKRAEKKEIPRSFVAELALQIFNLDYFVKQKFSGNRELYKRWKQEILWDENFRFID